MTIYSDCLIVVTVNYSDNVDHNCADVNYNKGDNGNSSDNYDTGSDYLNYSATS